MRFIAIRVCANFWATL